MKSTNNIRVPFYILGQFFCDISSTSLDIFVNDNMIYQNQNLVNSIHKFKIDEQVSFNLLDRNKLRFVWQSTKESSNKFLDLYKIIINNQQVHTHSALYKPYINDYIQSQLQGSIEQQKNIKDKIFYPGNKYGWYGEIIFSFSFMNKKHVDTQEKTLGWQRIIGNFDTKIFLDEQESIFKNATYRK